ncbi:MAG: CDP-2,3-bis-(O-geranylgeranyl)-sn-glycerol synthase [Methanobacteriota archaeon]|nr:MAG: CDP-2,3-bis-(O-geranylgeranyl)-sn-glycerol synthase [Euryarchaeota archaeon]
MNYVETALAGLWLMVPALVPNSAAVLLGGGRPLDLGRSWRGRRILGDGKTWRGFAGGAVCGIGVGVLQIAATEAWDLGEAWTFGPWPSSLGIIICLGIGSMLGDSMGSFVKRRLGVGRGAKAPGLDQYNFVIGAVLLVVVLDFSWFQVHYMEGNAVWGLVALLIVVPALHRGVNIVGYRLGRKDVPW